MRLYVGFITYGESTAKYLPYFLPSLKAQSLDLKILAQDNSETPDNSNAKYIKNNFPEIELKWSEGNVGFAKAFNRMINRAISEGAEYFLALNPDMILEPDFIAQAVKVMENTEKCGAVAPKILKWDFYPVKSQGDSLGAQSAFNGVDSNKKTAQIDSLGLKIDQEHRFSDSHQGEPDNPLANQAPKEVFGFTGAAVLFNLKALADAAFDNGSHKEYFDELMFMYKEDCDLSYRLRLAGWNIMLAPEALAYHNRQTAAKGESNLAIALNRRNKSQEVKRWSFLNQLILLSKFKNLPFSWRVKSATAWYQLKSLVFVLFFERFLLKELVKFRRLSPDINDRRNQLKIRIKAKEIEKFMYENS